MAEPVTSRSALRTRRRPPRTGAAGLRCGRAALGVSAFVGLGFASHGALRVPFTEITVLVPMVAVLLLLVQGHRARCSERRSYAWCPPEKSMLHLAAARPAR